MKKSLSILVALVMLCLAVIVPMPAAKAETAVTAVQEEAVTYKLENWVGESMPSGYFDSTGGNQRFPFEFSFDDWKKVYQRTGSIYSIRMDIKAPEGTEEGKVLALDVPEDILGNPTDEQLNALSTEGEFSALTEGSISFEIEIAELKEDDNKNNVSVLPLRKFMTVLFAWKDAQGSVTVQKMGVVVMHPYYEEIVLKENGKFKEAVITPFSRGDDAVNAVVEYLEAEQGQQLPYTTSLANGRMIVNMQLQQSDYEKIYANMPENAERSNLSVEIAPPAGAASFAITVARYAGENIAADLLLSDPFWDIQKGQQYVGVGLDYARVQHENNKITITPDFFEYNIMVAWKDGKGKPINVGTEEDERYVEHLCVTVVPANFDAVEIETTVEPSVITRYNREAEVLVMPEFMPPVSEDGKLPYSYTLQNGVLDIVTAYGPNDYQNVYDQLPGGTEQLYMSVEVTPPANAKYFNVASTGYPNEEAALGLMNIDKNNYQEITENRKTAGRGYDFAVLRRYDETILFQPTEGQHHLIVTWLDENKEPINVGTDDDPRYVEHLIINIRSENDDFVQVTDNSYIEEKDIRFNTTGWKKDMFTKAASYRNGKVSYYVSLSKLEELLEDNDGAMPELYQNLYTGVRAPKDAVAYVVGNNEPQAIENNKLVELGYRWHLVKNNGKWSIGDLINMGMWDFEWILEDGTRVPQKLSVEVTLVSDTTWMEEGGWTAISNDRMIINPDLNGSYGMIVKKDKDGEGHAYNQFTGNPVNEEKLRDINVFIGLEAPVITDEDGKPVEIIGYKANCSSGANVYIVTDYMIAEQETFLTASPLESFNLNFKGFKDKKIVPVNGLATFTSERLEAANGVLMDVYFYETYGTSIDNGLFVVIDWIGANGDVVKKEYFYHTNDGETRSYKAKGKKEKDITTVVTEATVLDENRVLYVEIPEQSIVENNEALRTVEPDQGAQYFQMTLEDTDGFVVQPDEGGVEILLPYPEGVNPENADQYEFTVEHYNDQSHMEKQELQVTATEKGLLFTATEFSPFMLSWTKVADDEDDGDNGGDNTEPDKPGVSGPIYYPDYDEDTTPEIPEDKGIVYGYVNCSKLNVRQSPSLFAKRITKISRNTQVTVLSVENNWAHVRLADGTDGYVYQSYLLYEQCSCVEKEAVVMPRRLNVRTGPGTNNKCVGQLNRCDAVQVLCTHNGWSKIVWDGGIAYVCTKYLDSAK